MFQKGNRYYADWRDASGIRHRKAFDQSQDAQLYEAAQKQSAHNATRKAHPDRPNRSGRTTRTQALPKSQGVQAPSAHSCTPSRPRAKARTGAASRKRSRKSLAVKLPRS